MVGRRGRWDEKGAPRRVVGLGLGAGKRIRGNSESICGKSRAIN